PPTSALFPYTTLFRSLELHDELRDPVFDLGEGHGVDDLVADAVVILATEVRLPPEVLELDRAQRLGDLLPVEALGLLHRGHEREDRKSTRLNSSHQST